MRRIARHSQQDMIRATTLKVGSRQNLQNWKDVRREFYLQKKNVLATTFEYTMHQFHENLN